MNLSLLKNTDPSGKMSKESYLLKNYPEEYNYIIEYSKSISLEEIPFREKVYICINDLKEIPTCKNPNCNNIVKLKNSTIGYKTYCSNRCISSDPKIKKKKEDKSIKKWGAKTPAQSEEIKNKIISTNIKRYGGNSAMSSKDIQKKSKETLLINYGVSHVSHSKEVQEKRIKSFKLGNYKENFKKTSLEKYGVDHPWMNKDVHKKTIDFFYQDYKIRIDKMIDSNKYKFIEFKKDISTNLIFKCAKCGSDFKILTYQFYYRQSNNLDICTNCYPISENASLSQVEIYEYIKSIYDGIVEKDYKKAINPYEIDIFLPELNLGFEYNGIWWHSEKFKNENYHLNKVDLSNRNNIKLITIWEDDWITKKEICKSFILNKIGMITDKIGARKCVIKEISYLDSRKFLYNNHLQGDCKSSIRIGLYNDDELVSLMTFSKLRLPMQRKLNNRNKEGFFELTRFCNSNNKIVSGGASKLLKYFIEKYKPEQIETYSDNLISDGDLYEKIGFKYTHTSKPGYWYVVNGIREHRFNWRKQKLVKLGYDPLKREEEIMNELGYWKIYNAGNKKWIWTK